MMFLIHFSLPFIGCVGCRNDVNAWLVLFGKDVRLHVKIRKYLEKKSSVSPYCENQALYKAVIWLNFYPVFHFSTCIHLRRS